MTRTSADRRSPWPWRVAVAAVLVALVAAIAVVQTRAWARTVLPSDQAVAALAGTPDGYLLVRGGAFDGQHGTRPDDTIVTDASDAGREHAVFTAARIQQFAAADGWLAVVTLDSAGSATLLAVEPATGRQVVLPLPSVGVVDGLAIGGGAVAATFTATDNAAGDGVAEGGRLLVWQVPSTGDQAALAAGVGTTARFGDEVAVTADGHYAVLRQFDDILLRVDLSGAEPDLVLGVFAEMQGLTADGRLVVADAAGAFSMVDVGSGDRQRLVTAVPADLDSSARLLRLSAADWGGAAVYDTGAGYSVQALTADGSRQLTTVDQVATQLVSVCAAPGAQLVAVTTAPTNARDDEYPRASATDHTSTTIYDVDTGAQVTAIDAWSVGWCQRYQPIAAG